MSILNAVTWNGKRVIFRAFVFPASGTTNLQTFVTVLGLKVTVFPLVLAMLAALALALVIISQFLLTLRFLVPK